MIQATSTAACHELKDDRKLGEGQQRVLALIERYPDRTDRELTRLYTSFHGGSGDPNQVRPRRSELAAAGYIVSFGKRKCTVTGKTALTWRVKIWDPQLRLDI